MPTQKYETAHFVRAQLAEIDFFLEEPSRVEAVFCTRLVPAPY
jgi:hypothetical protein